MTRTIDVDEAKTHLPRLLEDVEAGQEIVIARAGRPVAKMIRTVERRPGAWAGRVTIADDFDETPPELVAAFHAES